MSSAAQIAANRDNAQKSTGPTSMDGKAAVSKNALKTGLTGRTVLLASDDAALYEKHLESFWIRYNPSGDEETELVQSIADTAWGLWRASHLSNPAFTRSGCAKLADLHANQTDPQIRASLIETEVYLAYERPLRNLQTQESRLRRHLEKDMAALKEMQTRRKDEESRQLTQAAQALAEAIRTGKAAQFDPKALGFEFSIAQIEARLEKLQPGLLANHNTTVRKAA